MDICKLDTPTLDPKTNLPLIRATVPLAAEQGTTDVEEFGPIDAAMCLGVTSLPYPADDTGHAEGIVDRGCGNSDGVIVGGRDSRCAAVVGKLKPGDSALHSTDPSASAQVQCKANRICVLRTKGSDGKDITLGLDGKNDKVQLAAFGALVEITKDKMTLCGPGGASIVFDGDTLILGANRVLIGLPGPSGYTNVVAGMPLAPGAPPVQVAGPAAVNLFVAPGVYVPKLP